MRIATPLDIAWLHLTHLSGLNVPSFNSAVIQGNEDCPTQIELYLDGEPVATLYERHGTYEAQLEPYEE